MVFCTLFFWYVHSTWVQGPDAHFGQYYQVPAYVNPALVGNFQMVYSK